MTAAGQPKPELVAALIEELELAINWLQGSDPPPTADEARERFRTLREAATVAGASAIDGWLAELENEPFESRDSSVFLARLAQASRMLADPHADRELDWLGENARLAGELEYLAAEWRSGSERLGQLSMLFERCVTTLNERERADLSSKLTQKLCEEIQVQRIAQRRLLGSVEALRRWALEFSQEWAGAQRVLVAPRLAALRAWVQREASQLKLNFTWHIGSATVERDQVEPLTVLLRELFNDIVSDRQEPPRPSYKKRRSSVETRSARRGTRSPLDDGHRVRYRPTTAGIFTELYRESGAGNITRTASLGILGACLSPDAAGGAKRPVRECCASAFPGRISVAAGMDGKRDFFFPARRARSLATNHSAATFTRNCRP